MEQLVRTVTKDEAFEIINAEAPHTLPEAGTAKEESWLLRGAPLPLAGIKACNLVIVTDSE